MELSLDDIIKSNKAGFRRGAAPNGKNANRQINKQKDRSTFRPKMQGNFTRRDVNSTWNRDMHQGGRKQLPRGAINGLVNSGTAELLLSNLDYGVSETELHELYADFGPLERVSVHYDKSGRSMGTANIIFERRADAIKAMKQYNGVPLDGKPMSIQLAASEIPASTPAHYRTHYGGQQKNGSFHRSAAMKQHQRKGGRQSEEPTKRGNKQARKPVSAEELDAELDAYRSEMKIKDVPLNTSQNEETPMETTTE